MQRKTDPGLWSRAATHIRGNLVAYLALVVALSMTPAAASHLLVKTSDIKNRAVTAPKIRNRAVTSPKIRPNAVRTRMIRDGAVTDSKLAEGLTGVTAYAEVGSDGSVGRAKGIEPANVTRTSDGVYCVGGLDFNVRSAVAIPEAASPLDTQDRVAHVLVSPPGTQPFGCDGDRVRIQIVDLGVLGASPAGLVDSWFYVWLEE